MIPAEPQMGIVYVNKTNLMQLEILNVLVYSFGH